MNIIIVGTGIVGMSLAEQLSRQDYHVSVIDSDASLCREINGKLDVFTVTGSGTSPSVLKSAGIENADMVIAVTNSDESNLLVCNFAKQFSVPKRIARVRSNDYTQIDSGISLDALGVTHVIEPEKEVVKSILQYIEIPGLTQAANFQSDTVYLRGCKITSDMPLANMALREIDGIPGYAPMLVVVIIRDGHTVLPTGQAQLLPEDEIIVIMPKESFSSFRELINREKSILEKVIVFGDSFTAVNLVEALKGYADRIVLVDPNSEHGQSVAGKLDGVEVLNGDCTSVDVLQDIHVGNVDFFIAAGNDSEDNIMASLMAKAEGAKEVIAVRNDSRYLGLFGSLGLDHIINPREITSEKILESIHMLHIGGFLKLRNIDLEVIRFKAERNSRITGKPLRKLDMLFKKSIVISGVLRDGRMIVPNGDTVINENDEVLVVCGHENVGVLNRLCRSGLPGIHM